MLNRRGMSLVELLISLIVLAIVGAVTVKVMTIILSTSGAQIKISNSMGEARNGAMALPQELREVGYDTNTTMTSASTDLISISAHRITFRAMRGLGITCGTPTLTEFKFALPSSANGSRVARTSFCSSWRAIRTPPSTTSGSRCW